ncbi:MAG: ABC transporter permease [Acidimicrobiia bacterium]
MTIETPEPTNPVKDTEQPTVEPSFFRRLIGADADITEVLLLPVLAVLTALILGAFVIVLTDPELWRLLRADGIGPWIGESLGAVGGAYAGLFEGSFGSLNAVSETLVSASPVILAGLSVAVGFRAGLFNIGGEGQVLVGGLLAAIVGFRLDGLPFPIHLLAAIAAGILGGAVWGGIAGLLKARTGANEVITTIMLNFIATFGLVWVLKTDFVRVPDRSDPISQTVAESARLPKLLGFVDGNLRVHAGIILALLMAWFVWWLLFRSTIGYQFRAVGYNPSAARYGGMRVEVLYVGVMGVAGGLAGMAGADTVLGVLYRGTPGFSAGVGFDAIGLALLGRSHPGGVVLAGLLFGALEAGGRQMQVATSVPIDLVQIVQALVIVFIAAPALVKALYRVGRKEAVT